MPTTEFLRFRRQFSDDLRGNENPAKHALGAILVRLATSELERGQIIQRAITLAGRTISGTYKQIQKNLCSGKGNADYAYAFFYWLYVEGHRDAAFWEVWNLLRPADELSKAEEGAQKITIRGGYTPPSGSERSDEPTAIIAQIWVVVATLQSGASIRHLQKSTQISAGQIPFDPVAVELASKSLSITSDAATIAPIGDAECSQIFLALLERMTFQSAYADIFIACVFDTYRRQPAEWISNLWRFLQKVAETAFRSQRDVQRRHLETLTGLISILAKAPFPSAYQISSIAAVLLADQIDRATDGDLFLEMIGAYDSTQLYQTRGTPLYDAGFHALVLRLELLDDPTPDEWRHLLDFAGYIIQHENAMRGPLQLVSLLGCLRCLRRMLADPVIKAAIDEPDGHGTSALSCAAYGGHDSVAALLMQHGAHPNLGLSLVPVPPLVLALGLHLPPHQ